MPFPRWGGPRPPLHLTLQQYKDFITKADALISRLLVRQNYDSISNFITLYNNYVAAPEQTLKEYFPKYTPPIQPYKHTCVGLAIEVMNALKLLDEDFPGIKQSIMLVSCEENVQNLMNYATMHSGPQGFLSETEKDHVMVACHLTLDGRPGLFLSDLGYHIAGVVTVMKDRGYPHTGWFTQVNKPQCIKEYKYEYNTQNNNYIEWHEREKKSDKVHLRFSLVYVEKAFRSSIEVTEKRNLVWHVKSLVARDCKGNLMAGIYFISKRKETKLTVSFVGRDDVKQRKKLNLEDFLDLSKIPNDILQDVKLCNGQLHMEDGMLMTILHELAVVMHNCNFVSEIHDLNDMMKNLPIKSP